MIRIIPATIFLCICHLSFGQNVDRLDSLIQLHFKNGFNGNVIYAQKDSTIYSGNFGVCDYTNKAVLNDSSIFELGSNAKQITAVAIVQLIEKGLLEYSTEVDALIDGFPYSGITIEHLLRHQSGLPAYMKLMKKKKVWNRKQIACNQDVLDALIKFQPKPYFKPGTKFKYNNTGYMLLAMVIEEVTGLSFPDYLDQAIFAPTGMNNSAVIRRRYAPVDLKNNTEGYVFNKKTKKYVVMNKQPQYWSSYLDGIMGDGAISSTSLDMLKWNYALKNNTLISPESTEKLFQPDEVSIRYGFGFFIDTSEAPNSIYHQGSWAGYQTWTYYLPETDEYIVILCNNNYSKTRAILIDVLNNI